MLFIMHKINGQSSIQFAVLIVVLILALIAMQPYLKRAKQGVLREAADSIGSQYDPIQTNSDITTEVDSHVISTTHMVDTGEKNITETRMTTDYDTRTRNGTETVGAF